MVGWRGGSLIFSSTTPSFHRAFQEVDLDIDVVEEATGTCTDADSIRRGYRGEEASTEPSVTTLRRSHIFPTLPSDDAVNQVFAKPLRS